MNAGWFADMLPAVLAARAYIGSGGTLVPKQEEKRQQRKKKLVDVASALGVRAYIGSEQFPIKNGRRRQGGQEEAPTD